MCVAEGSGYSTPDPLKRFAQILQLHPAELREAVKQAGQREKEMADKTAAEEEDRARASFEPHLWVIGDRKTPSPIFVVAICGPDRFLRVPLPEGIATLSDEEQGAIVSRIASQHFVDSAGSAGSFGKIVGFIYRQTFETGWTLSVDGRVYV
jgi:hypothetical protein